MPDAIITSTESTFGTISGTFLDTGATVSGTVSGIVAGTLDGSVGVPGPQGEVGPAGPEGPPGPPGEGGVWGSIVGTLSNQTDLQSALNGKYSTSNPAGYITSSALTGYATQSWVTAGFYPLTGNPAGYITSSALTGYAPLASPAFTGNPTAPTAALADNDTTIATTAFVQQELAAGTAVAKNLEVYVRNQTGATLTAGTIVYINGATGNRPTVTKAQANNDANSAQTLGFVKTSIANNGFGFVIVRGECENLDTSALTEGAQLYLSPTTAGTWTTTKPSAPQHLVYVGIVIRSHPTQGSILVAVQNGYELDELHDVQIVSPTNGQVLKYDSATGLWKNATDLNSGVWGGITGTLSSQTDLQTALDAKLDIVDAESSFYPLTGNPSGFITSSALTGYATESWVTAGFYPLSGNPSGFLTSSALTPYLLSSTAASTYYPLTNPSGYITSAALSGYATESFVTSQGYITSSALTPYLTSSTAASTYQTLAGMSSYAPLASPALTGTPTAPTAPLSDIGSTIANCAFVKGQGYLTSSALTPYLTSATAASTYQTISGMSSYLTTSAAASTYLTQSNAATTYYPLSSNPAGYLTSAPVTSVAGKTGAVTLAVADVSGAAPLASPDLTGVPTAPTATAGTNTTQIATTAFVTAAVPAFATEAQAINGTSSTTAISPLMMRHVLANPMLTTYNSLIGNYSSFVSGAGSVSAVWSNLFGLQITAANGKAAFQPNSQVSYHSIQSRGKPELTVDWTKPMWFSFRFCYSSSGTIGNSNTVNRVTIGKVSSTFGDLSARGIGVKWTAGTAGAFTVMAHNGTSLSTSASAVTVSNTTYFPTTSSAADFMVYSDGAGNVTLFCNGVQVATTTGGPSSGTSPGPRFVFECDNTTSTSGTVTCDFTGVKSMLAY